MPTSAETAPAPRFRCPACQQTYRLRHADPAKQYLCQKCRVPLEKADGAETLAAAPAPPRPANLSSAPTTYERPVPTTAQRTILEPPPAPSSLPRLKADPAVPLAQTIGPADDLELSKSAVSPVELMRLLPESFDGYTIVRELARGGMGVVLLADQAALRRRVAMKVILPGAAVSDPAIRERFMREARAMAKLRHPHIVEVHGVGEVSGMPYLAMEFVEGHTLSHLIERDSLGYAQAATVLAKVARAMAYAHSRGVIHRDIKPANIMLRPAGEPVIMDFGLAKDFDANSLKLSMTGNIMGTPAYMSPEQAQGLQVDERSDIYSLGAVLYEMLTLEPPFEGATTIATMYNVVNTPPRPASEIRPGVPEALARVCAKALEKDPRDRYQNMDEFAGDLDRYGAGMQIGARGPSAIRLATDFARAHRVPMAAAGAVAVVAVLVLAALQFGWLRSGRSKSSELRAALTGGSPETRLLHVKALAGDLRDKRIKPDTPEFNDVIGALRLALNDSDPTGAVPAAAATALADAGDEASQEAVKQLLDPERPLVARCAAVNALGMLRAQGLALILSRTIRNDPAVEVRLAAVEAMPDSVGPDVMVYLIELSVKGEPPPVAAAAARKLGQLRTQKSLLSLYGGGEMAVAGQAISKLLETTKAYDQMLEDANNEINPQARPPRKPPAFEVAARRLSAAARADRLQAAYDLGVLADVRAEPALVAALQDPDADIALTAADALAKLPALKAPEKIAALLRSAAPAVRCAAARAYGKARPAPAGAPLSDALLTEKIGPVQAELAGALGRLRFAGAITPLVSVLAEGTPEGRRKAAWALGQIGDKSACGPLLDALAAATDKELKDELAGALSALTGQAIGPDAAQWREALKK